MPVDFNMMDPQAMALQLRKPDGAIGEEFGKVMAQYNVEPIAKAIEALELKPNDHVLEIGFGPGEGIAEAVRLTPSGFVAGIDHSDAMLKMAEQRNHKAVMQEHVELTIGSADELPYEDESFNKIFSVNVFHFWPNPSIELSEQMRVLKPGGRVVHFVVHPSSWFKGLDTTDVFIAREPQEIEKIFTAAGLRNVKSRNFESEGWKSFLVLGEK